MPITEQHRRALAYLGKSIREDTYGAPAFDEAGLLAALGKVRGLNLATVAMAVIRCAADPSIKTPGMIADPSSSVYVERVGPEVARRHTRPDDVCGHCAGEFGPACCDAPTKRPSSLEPEANGAAADACRAAIRAARDSELKGLAVREEVEA